MCVFIYFQLKIHIIVCKVLYERDYPRGYYIYRAPVLYAHNMYIICICTTGLYRVYLYNMFENNYKNHSRYPRTSRMRGRYSVYSNYTTPIYIL